MRKWPRPPEKPAPIPLNPEVMDEVCSILSEEFDEPDAVLARFMVGFPGWARREFGSAGSMIREMKRKHSPLLDVIRTYRVRVYDDWRYVDIEYRRRWLFDSFRIRAEGGDEDWCARAAGVASRALRDRGNRLVESDSPIFFQGMLWVMFQAFSGISLLYLWVVGESDARLLWAGAVAFALAAVTFVPGLAGRMFPLDAAGETGGALRRLCGVITVLSSIIAAVAAMLGFSGF